MEQEPLANQKKLRRFSKKHQKENNIQNRYQQGLSKLSMLQKKKDFPKLKGKAAEIKGLSSTVYAMRDRFAPDTDEYKKIKLLWKLNNRFEDILNQYPVSRGHAARRLKEIYGLRNIVCIVYLFIWLLQGCEYSSFQCHLGVACYTAHSGGFSRLN